jgi:hypothetical protein
MNMSLTEEEAKARCNCPAFPHAIGQHHESYDTGMTLRDYFAGKALQGRLVNHRSVSLEYVDLTEQAYGYADAMLKARQNNN